MQKLDLVGQRFGKLVVIERGPRQKGHSKWLCKCDCGNTGNVYHEHLRSGATTSCGCSMNKIGAEHSQWTGVGEISGQRWIQIKRGKLSSRKSRNNLDFSITMDYAWSLFLAQDRKCALTGIELKFGKRNTDESTASLDRIDNSKGYIEGNVQWLHKDLNRMKNVFSQEYFTDICRKVAQNDRES